jgi:16S rRNA (guanine527-N7)-methyltransferase
LGRGGLLRVGGPADFAEAFKVSRETIHRLEIYAGLLARWQKAQNLVAPSTLSELWHRHFADSAQICGLAPEARTWLDLGSGAGFPGLVIAILQANHRDFRMHLAESSSKKCAFLAEVARATHAPVEIHAMRIEALAVQATSLAPDIVTARALAPMPKLLDLAAPFFRPTTRGLFLKGREAASEIESARQHWRFRSELHPSLTASDSVVVEIADLKPAHAETE